MAKLILHQLTKDFGTGRPAVDAVSMEIRDGGFLALLGPSGCGKTTVLRMLAGFEAPTGGMIQLGDRVMSDAAQIVAPERRNMAMVFQSYALWPHMTVAENVGYPLKVRGVSGERYREKVLEALRSVRLEAYADRRPAALSGGQRQRVALARCLVTSPDVVLLDEPLANLDRHLRGEMEDAFREFHARSGATMIYVTHDQAEAMALATDVAVMAEGRLLQMASPAELYARPEGRRVGELVGRGAILSVRAGATATRDLDWKAVQLALTTLDNGPSVDVLVRPQDVHIGEGGLPAVVENVVFEGERYSMTLRLGDGQSLRAHWRERLQVGAVVPVVIGCGWRL
ncbi:ABC transporter ATP-binding protein [Rhizobium sp. CECT 9324]|uniref:ABC transporter ATP-binding protein n=1 Tax=Rhizobium sp. CECT 9324 TaxID=2845820 RepID=UPI001E41B231|nr:ABC transporter ATP-binding protein [Rhizobium sp. CECT 9324]CAH0341210.1 Vitamin B12 import ATP-binding protein BtuD [Rhizobium sp. CECT 9324]